MPSQHTYCGRVWNLIQACDVQSSDYISTPPSPEVEDFQMKTYYPAGDRTPDLLNQRQTCYQRGELTFRQFKIVHEHNSIMSRIISMKLILITEVKILL